MARLDETMGTAEPVEEVENTALWSDTVQSSGQPFSWPILKLANSMTKEVQDEVAKMGDWLVDGYAPETRVRIVPLKHGISRRYNVVGDDGEQKTQCYSPTGREHGIGDPGIACADCSLKEWRPNPKSERNDPPPCKESGDFLAWSITHETFVRVSFQSTAAKAGRFIEMLGKTKGLGQFAVELTSKKETKRFTYAVPVVTILPASEVGIEEIAAAREMLALTA